MIDWLREIGRGKRGIRSLTYTEAANAAAGILDGKATPAQTAAFLTAQKLKQETTEEIIAFIDSLRKRSRLHPVEGSIDCAGPFCSRGHSFLATLPTAFVLAACRQPVTLHSTPSAPPHAASALVGVVAALGIAVDAVPQDRWIAAADRSCFLFVPTERWCPSLSGIRAVREEIGIRTLFDTAEELLRPSDAPYMAIGIPSGSGSEKAADLLSRLGVQRALIVQSAEGSEDVPVDRRTRVVVLRDEVSDIHIIDPHTFGLHAVVPAPPASGWTAGAQAQTTLDVLAGRAAPAYRNAVLLNSAMRLWIADRTDTIEEGIEHAKSALDNGLAWKHYTKWREKLEA
ncbi:anthranilate phosphoribosyltransferase [Paenibacillus koleovorans]|uniref:anthranilate phosphoribosyltransferase n=1 Tax=Paenibacillus koleovorans TaxID=121608 RepID=UPI000FDC655A|nr:anthranilate phosphoribosyltransferase [Paenibacillus koleovorans]